MDLTKYLVCSVCGQPTTFIVADHQGRGSCCRPTGWAISWQNIVTGTEGIGRPVFGTKAACQSACDGANHDFPTLLHWPVEVKHGS